MDNPSAQLPSSQRTSYQFPVYRWISWLAVAGFAMGLTMMFFISGIFGIPAPLGWAALVIIFAFGVRLLDRPKLLLMCMLFYFMLMPGNRVLGLVGVPLPGFLDELFFLPLIAVIVMNWIQRRQVKEATLFPLAFCVTAALSWYVNGRPAPFTAVQVTLVMLKSYILWYFCRLTCTFQDGRQLSRWVWGYIIYAAIQFPYNILWHRALWPKLHPDLSGGVFGPDGRGAAHTIGYMSVFALILLAGWWISQGAKVSRSKRWWALGLALVITYNFIFMTDTKHALFLFPLVFTPFLLHPRFPIRLRIWLIAGACVFLLSASVYLQMSVGRLRAADYIRSVKESPKAEVLYAVTADFGYIVRYPMLGAGPGQFASNQAREAGTPLARRYILPYYNEARRLGYFGRSGSTVISSVLGSVNTDYFVVMGEFGWVGAVIFYGFYIWVVKRLFQKSKEHPLVQIESGVFLSLACCIVFLILITCLTSASTLPALVFPLWILMGRAWDMKTMNEESTGSISGAA